MPVMNGYVCAQRIKDFYEQKQPLFQCNELDKFCPYLVACSAHISVEIEKEAKVCGFNMAVESPVSIDTIKDVILVQVIKLVKDQIQS